MSIIGVFNISLSFSILIGLISSIFLTPTSSIMPSVVRMVAVLISSIILLSVIAGRDCPICNRRTCLYERGPITCDTCYHTDLNCWPIVEAGPDKEIFEGETVVLEGSGSDVESTPATTTFSWACQGGTLSNSGIAQPTFTGPAVSASTDFTCTLTVTDNMGIGAFDTVKIKVKDTALFVSLLANPDCVNPACYAPLKGVSLTATVLPQSTAIGQTANYTFWCDCSYVGIDISTAIAQCGNYSHKADGANPTSYTAQGICDYTNSAGGTYSPKVIVEKGLAAAAESRVANFIVNGSGGGPPGPPGPPPPPSDPNTAPSVSSLSMNPSQYSNDCSSVSASLNLNPIVYWQFSDSDGDIQLKYRLEFDPKSNFTSQDKIILERETSSTSAPLTDGKTLSYGTTYHWRIKVWDSRGKESNWALYPQTYTTPPHEFPAVDFSWSPDKPKKGQEIQFTDKTVPKGGSTIDIWQWNFAEADPSFSSVQNPTATYENTVGEKPVILKVKDTDNLWCDKTKNLNVTTALPKWREVIPW